MPKNTKQLRELWQAFECNETEMVLIPFALDKIRVAPPTTQAFECLAAVLQRHRYVIRTQDTDSYNCRAITGGTGKSLHSYGIALDVNWKTNPFRKHGGSRLVRYSEQPTQDLRALDVRAGTADTDMTKAMIDDVEKIVTTAGTRVFEWGGWWKDRKDCMHFELDVSPAELAAGIDTAAVAGFGDVPHAALVEALAAPAAPVALPGGAVLEPASATMLHTVIARDGLRLRSGPSQSADVARVVPHGTRVNVIGRDGDWALVDLEGDGKADGFMSRAFLRSLALDDGAPALVETVPGGRDVTGLVGVDMAAKMFPATPKANIAANLPFVLAGLRSRTLGDKSMVLMALATIRAETEGFVPIDEGRSQLNTAVAPFDLYDAGTAIGKRLGNTRPGDGARFRGRGYVQLTGRFNYAKVSGQIGIDLNANPAAANDPTIAGLIIAQFLKNKESAVRAALGAKDLKAARRLVNGGSHGFDRFRDAFERGSEVVPA